MIKYFIASLLYSLTISSCGQSHISNQTQASDKNTISIDTNLNKSLFVDTSKIAILPIDTSNYWVFKNTIPLKLTNQDLQTIDELLIDCIITNNSRQDTTKRFKEYINLKNYKRQYVPFIDSNGEKKIFINCFCLPNYPDEFNYWKKSLVEVEDGGSCFFHLTISLTARQYEQLYTNGYG